jgi:2',3'-cyclic-nucleotide 2'-phosphodiesterase (5'-nucleotidase family)
MLGLTHSGLPFLAAAAIVAHPAVAKHLDTGPACHPGDSLSLKIAATTDVHGHIRGWNYYADRADPSLGLARAATIVDSVRAANPSRVVLVDAGDLLEGTPLAYVAARMSSDRRNSIIAVMNAMRYDAAVIGNHEFNYGVPYLDSAVAQARFPMLAANVSRGNSSHAYATYTIVRRAGVDIGIIGATTPGSNLWDASNLAAARLHISDIVPAVRAAVADARTKGADAIVVVLHSGLDGPSSYDTVATGVASENVAARVAAEVPGINILVYGHSHRENPGQTIGQTLLIQPKNWAASVAVVTLPMTCKPNQGWASSAASGLLVQSKGHAEDSSVVEASQRVHLATLAYVNSTIGTTPDAWRADSSRMGPTPLINLILDVERRISNADIASASAFDLHARLGPGAITVAQIAQLYPYDNTLRAIRITGEQLKAYLEYSSRYYKIEPDGSLVVDPGVAGYNFDMISGVHYTIDVSRPVGQRIAALTYHGKSVTPADTFTMALNNYRQTGGGGYAMLRDAPVIYDKQQEIRDLLIDEVRRLHTLHKADYDDRNWSFVKPGMTP